VVAQASVDKIAVAVSSHSPGVNSALTVTARARNAAGQIDTNFNGPASWSDKTRQLSPSSPSDFVNGVATTTASVSMPYHNDQITVSSAGLSGTSGTFNVIGPLDHFSFVLGQRNVPIGTSFTVNIYARDAAGNLLTGYSGSPSWSDASGSLSPSSPAPFSGGLSTNTTVQVADPAHSDRITVSDAGVQSSSSVFDVLGSVDHFTFSTLSTVATNQPFKLVVRAVDLAGNTVTSSSGSPLWADPMHSLSPSSPAPFISGVSVNSCTSVGTAQAGDQIRVADFGAGVFSQSPKFDVTSSQVFSAPGGYTFTLPCAASLTVTAIGAGGGSQSCFGKAGGRGATVAGSLTVSAGEPLTAGVGGVGGGADCTGAAGSAGTGSGANGGAGGAAGEIGGAGGGGASFLSTGTAPPTASSLLLLGGGGGGAGGEPGGDADSGGRPQPPNQCPGSGVGCGGGAGFAPGGAGGSGGGWHGESNGSVGGFLSGGSGGGSTNENGGGGGGGGYYGGGGGGAGVLSGSGGGGQSFLDSSATSPSGPAPTSSPAEVSITYAPPT
jgi:hypothetical protein